MNNILITGCCGLLGQKLIVSLKDRTIGGVDLLPNLPDLSIDIEYFPADLTDSGQLDSIIDKFQPECIVNSAGYTNVDGCEQNKSAAYRINTGAVESMVDICARRGIKLVQLSTDYIFNGKNGPYSENDTPDPIGYYGQTKLLAEEAIKKELNDYIIVRTNVLYGYGIGVRPNFVDWVIKGLQLGKTLTVVTDQMNNPTLADNLADGIAEMIEIDFQGTLHFAGADYLSRFDFAFRIARFFEYDPELIIPVLTEQIGQSANRPSKGGLRIDKCKASLKTAPIGVEQGLSTISQFMQPNAVD